MKIKTLTVSEVTSYIKKVLDNDFILNNLSVKGEISNLKYHSSGHIYFSLKDDKGKVNCVMFKGNAISLNFKLEEGMEVIISGRASMYPATGSFQIYCHEIQKEGQGELFIKFERLKEKLSREGYFDEYNKKMIPKYPERVGVVTSPTGAAIRDIINVATRRNNSIDIVLYPAKVQGIDAYKDIMEGIKYFNEHNNVDIIIVGRGGGSIEELWNFNEEELAMSVYNSNIPIISAVGHEIDYTICDFVADVRAATPSQGAEIAVPLKSDMINNVGNICDDIYNSIQYKLKSCRTDVSNAQRILKIHSPLSLIANSYLEVDNIKERLNTAIKSRFTREKKNIDNLNSLLMAYNPVKVMGKGYAILEDEENNVIISKNQLIEEQKLNIILKDGKVTGNFNPLK